MSHTLSSIAKDTGFSLSTVKRTVKGLGNIGTAQGNGKPRLFSDAEYQEILNSLPIKKTSQSIEFVESELLEDEPTGMIQLSNGWNAESRMTFANRDYSQLTTHLQEETRLSGQSTAQTLNNLFETLTEADKQLGAAIGAKRLQNVLGTADSVFQEGLADWSESQGLKAKK